MVVLDAREQQMDGLERFDLGSFGESRDLRLYADRQPDDLRDDR